MPIKKLPSTGDRPQRSRTKTGLPEGVFAGGRADSAGFSWAGRSFSAHEDRYAGDTGATPPEYLQILSQLRAAADSYRHDQSSGDPQRITASFAKLATAQNRSLAALKDVRMLVPLLAEAGELGYTPEGRLVEKTQELSIVTVQSPDGRKALPVFTSTATMSAWDQQARPIPVPMQQVLLAAADEQCPHVIIDPGSPERELGIRQNRYEALATGTDFKPAWADAETIERAERVLCDSDFVRAVALLPADIELRLLVPETELVLGLRAGLDASEVAACTERVENLWRADEHLLRAVDSLKIRVVSL